MSYDDEGLPTWARIGLGGAGVAALLSGAMAVFLTDNGTGAAALVAAGLLLGLVGALGRLPHRVSLAGADADFQRIVDRALDVLPDEARAQVAAIALNEAPTSTIEVAATRRVWQDMALEALQRVAPDNAVVNLPDSPDVGHDAVVSAGPVRVFVEFVHGRRLEYERQRLRRLVLTLSRARRGNAFLLVSATPQSGQTERAVQWQTPQDDGQLRDALLRAIEDAEDALRFNST